MTDLLVHDINPTLKRKLEERARAHGRSLTDEVRAAIERGMADERDVAGSRADSLGTRLFGMLPDEWRGDDLVFGLPRDLPEPAEFG